MLHRLKVFNFLQAFISQNTTELEITDVISTPDPSIHRLPPEILIQIFFLSEKQTYKSRYPHFRLTWVCRYWREIVNGFSGFWPVIQFYPWRGKEFIQELVSRSGSARLSIFSPLGRDICTWKLLGRDNLVQIFDDLLTSESNRIELMYMNRDLSGQLSKVLATKNLPVMHIFICHSEPSVQALEVIASSSDLRNLEITLFSLSSLIPLKPSFERLRRLDIRLPHTGPCTREFFHCLSCFNNLELLTICTLTDRHPESGEFYIQAGTILPKQISLEVTDYTLIEQLRAPALRSLIMTTELKQVALLQTQNYLIFDDYDLSSITCLFIRGPRTIYESSGVRVSASDGKSPRSVTWGLNYRNLDLRGNLPPSPFVPIQFEIYARTHYTSLSSGSSFFLKVLPKLHNIQILFITLFDWPKNPSPQEIPATSGLEIMRVFLEEILGNLRTSTLQGIMFINMQFELDLLRVLFEVINSYSWSLARSLDWIYFSFTTSSEGEIQISDAFGEELVGSIRRRQEAGHKPLRTFVMFEGASNHDLSENNCNWVAEAGTLGIQFGNNYGSLLFI